MSQTEIINKIYALLEQLPAVPSPSVLSLTKDPTRIIGVIEVAEMIGKSPNYLRNCIRKSPTLFPPVLKDRKTTKLQWRYDDVVNWMNNRPTQKAASRRSTATKAVN